MSFGPSVRNGLSVGLGASASLTDTTFTPSVLFNNGEAGGWYDPSDISTLFQDTAGTTPVTAAGQSVALVKDKSGRGADLTQGTAASMPTYQVDASGKPYLNFDGSNDFYTSPAMTPAVAKAQVITGVYKTSDAARSILLEYGPSATVATTGGFTINAPTTNGATNFNWVAAGTAAVALTATPYAAGTAFVLTGQMDINAPSTSIRMNSTSVGSSTNTLGTASIASKALYVGRRDGTTLPYNGRIYGLIVRFGANLTASQLAQVEQWMRFKTGLA